MKLKAIDTLHVSAVKPENIAPGEQFELNDGDAKALIARGLATEVKAKAEPAAPKNKAEPAPKNKSA